MSTYLLSLLSGIGILAAIILIALMVLIIISTWLLLEKAGEKGWKSLIPFYCDYTLYKLVWQPKFYVIYFALSAVSFVAELLADKVFAGTALAVVFAIIEIAFTILSVIVNFYFCRKLAFAFGKSSGFAIGLFFLYPIFLIILGLGKAEYIGKSKE